MKLFKWIEGKQSTTKYYKWCFLYFKFLNFGIDGYILKYEAGTSLPIHKDTLPAPGGAHYRLNIKLKGKSKFWCPSIIFSIKDDLFLFRPDLFYHSLTTHTKTYKISIGLAIFNKKKHAE